MKKQNATDDPDLNQESVTDAMRGENNIPDVRSPQTKKGRQAPEQR